MLILITRDFPALKLLECEKRQAIEETPLFIPISVRTLGTAWQGEEWTDSLPSGTVD